MSPAGALRLVEPEEMSRLLDGVAPDFGTYERLLAAIEEKTARIERQLPGAFACRSGCHHCCQAVPTILPVEWAYLRASDRSPAAPLVSALHPGEGLCRRLEADGRCAIYAHRPVVCRTQGHLFVTEDGDVDHCPWNFGELEEVDDSLVFRLEDLHTTLLRVNLDFLRRAFPERFVELAGFRVRFH